VVEVRGPRCLRAVFGCDFLSFDEEREEEGEREKGLCTPFPEIFGHNF